MTPLVSTLEQKCACGGSRCVQQPYNPISEAADWVWVCERCGEEQPMTKAEVKIAIQIFVEERFKDHR